MKIIVGLGNPGKKYSKTKHNIGFMIIDSLAQDLGIKIDKRKFGGLYTETIVNGERVIFLKPQKYINLSGHILKNYLNYFKINSDDVLVISDDLDMLIGKLKLKIKGSSGGHNGLKNIELNLKTKNYKRLKIGISNDKTVAASDYVLSSFDESENEKLAEIIEVSKQIIVDFISMDFLKLMNQYNKR
jgi:peptidyl-tRNA hydrolase, PTH1 family